MLSVITRIHDSKDTCMQTLGAVRLSLRWCSIVFMSMSVASLNADFNPLLNGPEFVFAFARGTLSKIEFESIIHPEKYENPGVIRCAIGAFRAIHDTLSMYNSYSKDCTIDPHLCTALLTDLAAAIAITSSIKHVTVSEDLPRNNEEGLKKELSDFMSMLRGQVLPELERLTAVFIAYCNTNTAAFADQQVLYRILFASVRLCQTYIDQDKKSVKDVFEIAARVHVVLSIYQVISRYNFKVEQQRENQLREAERFENERRQQEQLRQRIEHLERLQRMYEERENDLCRREQVLLEGQERERLRVQQEQACREQDELEQRALEELRERRARRVRF